MESNKCFCPAGPPCAPEGTFNVSMCQYESPVLLSFPHFYLGKANKRIFLFHRAKIFNTVINFFFVQEINHVNFECTSYFDIFEYEKKFGNF